MADISDTGRARHRRLAYVLGPAVLAAGLAIGGATQFALGATAHAAIGQAAMPAPAAPAAALPALANGPVNCEFNGTLITTIVRVGGMTGGTEHAKVSRQGCPGMYLTSVPASAKGHTYQGYYYKASTRQFLPCLGHYVRFTGQPVTICPSIPGYSGIPQGTRMRVRTQPDANIPVGVKM
jgi:hypothetical protein